MKSIYQFYETYSTTLVPSPSHKFKAKREQLIFFYLGLFIFQEVKDCRSKRTVGGQNELRKHTLSKQL